MELHALPWEFRKVSNELFHLHVTVGLGVGGIALIAEVYALKLEMYNSGNDEHVCM